MTDHDDDTELDTSTELDAADRTAERRLAERAGLIPTRRQQTPPPPHPPGPPSST
jgi:hypothetical protein